jgi:hypothetical protein
MGGMGVTDKTVVETMFRECRPPFRVPDGPTEVHRVETYGQEAHPRRLEGTRDERDRRRRTAARGSPRRV